MTETEFSACNNVAVRVGKGVVKVEYVYHSMKSFCYRSLSLRLNPNVTNIVSDYQIVNSF